ncbi:MAG: hypothetical protein HPY81_05215 [Firmicutes bacterium]|nr:hypothetical protein [Bacillota bacterium]
MPFPWPAPDLPPIGRHPTPAAGPISLPTSQELRPPAQPVEAPVVDPVEKEGRFPEQPMVNRAADGSMPSGLKSVVNEVTGWPAELVNNPVVAGIVLAEVLALPRSRRPFRPSYRR